MELVFYIFLGILIFYIFRPLLRLLIKSDKEGNEYDQKLKERLKDEYIIDPETGAKLTLEQAESGHWIAHDNEFRTIPETEIENLYSDEQKNAERAINYLKESRQYRKQRPTPVEVEYLEKTNILNKYDDWSYSDSFRMEYCSGFSFVPKVSTNNYTERQIMFWIKLKTDFGHYYLREKSNTEKFFDLIRNDDELKLTGYESFTIKKTDNLILIINLLKNFEKQKGFEIEFFDSNLFIKNTKIINISDIKRIEKIIKNIC